jgi:hypothetical protein
MRIPAVLLACGLALGAYTLNADGWAISGEAPKLYAGDVDMEDSPSGKGSVVLRRTETSHPYGSARLAQTLPAEQYAGKRVRLHAHVRFQDSGRDQGGVWIGANDNSHMHGLTFSHGWTSYEATVTFPADLKKLAIGVSLNGPGSAKVDALELEVLGDAPPGLKGTRIDEVVQRDDNPA